MLRKQCFCLLCLMLASDCLLAIEEFAPIPQHLNVFIQNPKQAAYLLKNETATPKLTQVQQRDFLHFVVVRLGLPDATPRLLSSKPKVLHWLPALSNGASVQNRDNGVIKTHWKNNMLFIAIQPNRLDYDSLLQNALTGLEQANNGQLPVINGRDLKAALEKRDGVALPIYKRPLATKKATQHAE